MLRNDVVRRLGLRAFVVATALTALALTGCGRPAKVYVVEPAAKVVVIKKGHTHYKRCGHYKHKGKWYFAPGHVHKKYCGHRKVKGNWVLQ